MPPDLCVIYCRQSLDRGDDELAVRRQESEGRELAERRGWDVAAVLVDNNMSGRKGKARPDFLRLLEWIDGGRIRAVVSTELSRITRNPREQLRVLEACCETRVMVATTRQGDHLPWTATGALMMNMLQGVATFESDLKAERQRSSIAQAVAQGRRVGGRRPFGYDQDGTTVREDEAALVRSGYNDFLAGVPLYQIAQKWNAAGSVTGQGNAWTGDSVRVVLRNARNAGLRSYAPVQEAGRRNLPTEDLPKAVWPAIVPEEQWRAVMAKTETTPRKGAPRAAKRLLTGIAVCGARDPGTGGLCGVPVWGGTRPGGAPSYRCRKTPGHLQRDAPSIDAYVSTEVVRQLSSPDAARFLAGHDRPDAAALRARRAALEIRLDALADALGTGDLDAARYRTQVAKVRAELAAVEAEQAEAGSVDLLAPLVQAEDVEALWDELGTARQRAVIRSVVDVTLRPPGRGRRTFRPESVILLWMPRTGEELAETVLERMPG